MVGLLWGVLLFIFTLALIMAYLAFRYEEGEQDFKEHKYKNASRGLGALWYDRGWDSAHREKLRIIENQARLVKERLGDGE